ncbi:MAG: hypothetical protein WCN92_02215 [Eubacteriales bacterium]
MATKNNKAAAKKKNEKKNKEKAAQAAKEALQSKKGAESAGKEIKKTPEKAKAPADDKKSIKKRNKEEKKKEKQRLKEKKEKEKREQSQAKRQEKIKEIKARKKKAEKVKKIGKEEPAKLSKDKNLNSKSKKNVKEDKAKQQKPEKPAKQKEVKETKPEKQAKPEKVKKNKPEKKAKPEKVKNTGHRLAPIATPKSEIKSIITEEPAETRVFSDTVSDEISAEQNYAGNLPDSSAGIVETESGQLLLLSTESPEESVAQLDETPVVSSVSIASLVLAALSASDEPNAGSETASAVTEITAFEENVSDTTDYTHTESIEPEVQPEITPAVFNNPLADLVIAALKATEEPEAVQEPAFAEINDPDESNLLHEIVSAVSEETEAGNTVQATSQKTNHKEKKEKEPKPEKTKKIKAEKAPKPEKIKKTKEEKAPKPEKTKKIKAEKAPKPQRIKKEKIRKSESIIMAFSLFVNRLISTKDKIANKLPKRTKKIIELAVVSAAVLVIIFFVISLFSYHVPVSAVPMYNGLIEESVNVRDIEVGLDEQLQKAADTKSGGNKRAFKFFANKDLMIDEWYGQMPLVLGNIDSNKCDFLVTILDKNDKILYRSMGITPGNYLPSVKLFEMMDYGTYDLMVIVAAYNQKTFEKIGVQHMKLKLVIGLEQTTEQATKQ